MKKLIYFLIIPIFVLFNDRVFADTIKPTYLTTFTDNTFSGNVGSDVSLGTQSGRCVLMYETSVLTSSDYEFTFLNPNNTYYANIYVAVSSTTDYRVDSSSSLINIVYSNGRGYINNTIASFNVSTKYIYITSLKGCVSPDNISFSGVEPTPEPVPPYEYEFKGLIYVPEDDVYNKCYVVQNEDVIRGYDRIPLNNSIYNYRDYYINSSYIYKDGSGQWSQYSTLPVCLDSDILTNNLYYRLDFDRSLIMFIIMSIFCVFLPIKLFSKIFKKGVL